MVSECSLNTVDSWQILSPQRADDVWPALQQLHVSMQLFAIKQTSVWIKIKEQNGLLHVTSEYYKGSWYVKTNKSSPTYILSHRVAGERYLPRTEYNPESENNLVSTRV